MNNLSNHLREELKFAGATDAEINELMPLANRLKLLNKSRASLLKAESHMYYQNKLKILLPIGITSLVSVAIGMFVVILSQTVLPGNLLYPVQKLSDNVSISIDSNYRGMVMMKRAQEVKQLIAVHANSNLVLATLNDYKSEASVYETYSTNYAALEYCESSLRQAAPKATGAERQAINSTLLSLRDV